MKCPQCREESIGISRVKEAATVRDVPSGRLSNRGQFGPVLRYECECLRCRHKWKPRDQKKAAELWETEVT